MYRLINQEYEHGGTDTDEKLDDKPVLSDAPTSVSVALLGLGTDEVDPRAAARVRFFDFLALSRACLHFRA